MNETPFYNAYGEEMTPTAMIHQLLHRVSELEQQSVRHTRDLTDLNTQLKDHDHEPNTTDTN